ncbi:MAG: hypothetical protein LBB85_10365 [Dysgonamonadaceae bacterium]|jgi:hypothetical protein|nr:hypothetical protein [Dysgonamonadaceae bacterium]
MNTLSEFLPLIFIAAFIILSVRRGMNQKKQEEMSKTTLPGRKSGAVIPVQETVSSPVQANPGKKITPKPVRTSSQSVLAGEKEPEEEIIESVLNIEDPEDIKKAVIYTEIFNRKAY